MRRSWLSFWSFCAIALLAAASGCGDGEAPTASMAEGEGSASGLSAASRQSDADQEREARRQADLHPVVEFTTTAGTFRLKLNRAKAEKTVDNFLEYVAAGFYQGTIFHQVDRGFVVAAGGYTEEMQPKRTRVPIRNEAHNGLKNVRGTVAMVRSPGAVDSATSQFLINLADNPFLDHKSREIGADGADQYGYCVFGEVVDGWETIEAIAASEVKPATVHIARPGASTDTAKTSGAAADVVGDSLAAQESFDEVTFDALPARPIVIQAARRVK